jgi:hypothetical protein
MTKLLAKLFNRKNNKNTMSAEERYIRDRNPQSILDVENFSRQFERSQASSHNRTWSIL